MIISDYREVTSKYETPRPLCIMGGVCQSKRTVCCVLDSYRVMSLWLCDFYCGDVEMYVV